LLFAVLALRFVFAWANTFAGLSLPSLGDIGFTLVFTAFSVLHAGSTLGWRRAIAFLVICAVVSWAFEAVGIATGLVYGPYHYSAQLGAKLGGVPVIIPLAWFMMVYASWVVAQILLQDAVGLMSLLTTAARVIIAAMAMTAWDTVMDPGKARAGVWTWEQGGAYFGVPLHNFVGWIATTVTVYSIAELFFRRMPPANKVVANALYAGLPVLAYSFVAIDNILRPSLPALQVVAFFGMGFIALLALFRLILPKPSAAAG
jgi:putative membrane protein